MRNCLVMKCLVAVGLAGSVANAQEFTFTIENLGVQPLTPVFVVTHDSTFDIFDEGAIAGPELVAIAEDGMTGPMQALAAGSPGVNDFGVGGFIMPGESTTVTVTADADHPYLSFVSMLPITNDAFIGLSFSDNALDLFRDGGPTTYDFTLSYLEVWDAGSEINTESADDVPALGGSGSPDEFGVITRPHAGILGIGDVGLEFDFFGSDIARITVVPEPASMLLLGFGALAWSHRRSTCARTNS